jgi:high-affinity nickel-transport protein
MLVSDGANGWWISRLIGRTDRRAIVASRTMTLAVACVSLLVAAIGIGRLASGWFDGLLEGRELAVGLSVVMLIGLSYLVACRLATPSAAKGARS